MTTPLVRQVQYRPPFVSRHVPFLARYYRFAFQRPASRKAQLFLYVPLQRLFVHYARWRRQPAWGTFDYAGPGTSLTVRYDARNLQYHALFGWLYEKGYEPEVALLLDVLLPEDGVFYDVGSNWGYFPLFAASRRPRVVVHAFEPHPRTFGDLTSCVEQAKLKQNVTCHNLALSSSDGEAFIQLPDGLHSAQAEVSQTSGTRIVTRRLDALKLPPPHFIKLDVEGHEVEALRGAANTLRQAQPFLVFESKRDYHVPERTLAPLFYLASLGYRFFQPCLQRSVAGRPHLVPFGYQAQLKCMQPVEEKDILALTELTPATRFLLQDDLNLLACHEEKLGALGVAFGQTAGT